jgi:glycosyltransferase involved in cell wall biosynthesis
MTKLIIVNIPAYNEAENIEKVIKLIPRRINDYEVKVQVIDD